MSEVRLPSAVADLSAERDGVPAVIDPAKGILIGREERTGRGPTSRLIVHRCRLNKQHLLHCDHQVFRFQHGISLEGRLTAPEQVARAAEE